MTIALFSPPVSIEKIISQNTQAKRYIYPNKQKKKKKKKKMRISSVMYIHYKLPKIKLPRDIKITIIEFQNKNLFFLSSFFFIVIWFFSFYFFRKIMCSLIPVQWHQICPNWQSNIDMVNNTKEYDTEFLSDFNNSVSEKYKLWK